jgi:hypothetical protein
MKLTRPGKGFSTVTSNPDTIDLKKKKGDKMN